MSVFKTFWIILKVQKIKENDFFLDLFCYDYWKIKLKAKKTKDFKNLDIWYNINFEIDVKKQNSIHEIKNIKIKNDFNYINKEYSVLIQYLDIVKLLIEKLPNHEPVYEIYNVLNEINNYKNITEEKLIFSKLKLLNILWVLNIHNSDLNIQKILSFISKESISNVLKLKWLDEKTLSLIKNMIK